MQYSTAQFLAEGAGVNALLSTFLQEVSLPRCAFSPRCCTVILIHADFDGGVFANGHTSSNTPDPIRTRKLSRERPGQYWGGGPPGKPLGCCWLFAFGIVGFYLQKMFSR